MSYESILYGPDSEPANLYAAKAPAPGDNGPGGPIAYRGIHPLGKQLVLEDGRKFRFTLAGVLMVPGDTQQAAAALTTSENLTPGNGEAVGARTFTFTHGSATTVINFFAEGYVTCSVTPAGGDMFKIASHLALTSAVAGDVVNLAPGHAVRRATTTTTRLDLTRNPFAGCIEIPASVLTGAPMGVAVSAIANGGTGWLQTRGACGVLTDGAAAVIAGTRAMVPAPDDAGAIGVETPDSTDSDVEVTIGTVMTVAGDQAWSTIFLTLDG